MIKDEKSDPPLHQDSRWTILTQILRLLCVVDFTDYHKDTCRVKFPFIIVHKLFFCNFTLKMILESLSVLVIYYIFSILMLFITMKKMLKTLIFKKDFIYKGKVNQNND